MPNMHDFEVMIPSLPIAARIALREKLDQSIDELLEDSHEVSEKAELHLMEQRLDDYIAGKIQSKPWKEAISEIRSELGL